MSETKYTKLSAGKSSRSREKTVIVVKHQQSNSFCCYFRDCCDPLVVHSFENGNEAEACCSCITYDNNHPPVIDCCTTCFSCVNYYDPNLPADR